MIRLWVIALLPVLLPSVLSADAPYDIYRTGADTDREIDAGQGLLLMGGGGDVDPAMRWFLGLANGGDVVVLRASGSDGYNDYFYAELGVSLNSVTSIVFHDREAAFAEEILTRIEEAEVIFLAGGDQSKYYNYWRGTPVQEALNERLFAMAPIGGTSAGLAVLGQHLYTADHRHDLTSPVALKNPLHSWITLSSDFLHSPLMTGVLTDSHFRERGRLGRLAAMVANLYAQDGQAATGLGIDEATALAIDGSGEATLHRDSTRGEVFLVQLVEAPTQVTAKEPLEARFLVIGLGPQSRLRLPELAVEDPASIGFVEAKGGRLRSFEPEAP